MKYTMIDIETTGVDPNNSEIIQVGLLDVVKNGSYYEPLRHYVQVLHNDETVTDPWILKTHAKLLPIARSTEYEAPTITRAKLLGFLGGKANFIGLNAAIFDIPFCVKKGILKPEDYHYRVYELTGSYNLAQDVLGIERRDELFKQAQAACDWIKLPEGEAHDAIYDCYNQLKCLNGIIRLLK